MEKPFGFNYKEIQCYGGEILTPDNFFLLSEHKFGLETLGYGLRTDGIYFNISHEDLLDRKLYKEVKKGFDLKIPKRDFFKVLMSFLYKLHSLFRNRNSFPVEHPLYSFIFFTPNIPENSLTINEGTLRGEFLWCLSCHIDTARHFPEHLKQSNIISYAEDSIKYTELTYGDKISSEIEVHQPEGDSFLQTKIISQYYGKKCSQWKRFIFLKIDCTSPYRSIYLKNPRITTFSGLEFEDGPKINF